MENFSERLKEERERLGMSQAKFAEACGIGKSAQYSYENGGREPPLSYLRAAEKLGVDTLYVQQGVRIGKDWAYARAYMRLLERIESLLALDEGVLKKLCDMSAELDKDEAWSKPSPEGTVFRSWSDSVRDWLSTSSMPDACIDASLLSSLLDSVDQSALTAGLSMSTEKRVRAALMLYRYARPTEYEGHPKLPFSEKLSQDLIDKTVKLAAS